VRLTKTNASLAPLVVVLGLSRNGLSAGSGIMPIAKR
jgi:hypothetical protein